VPRVLIVEPGEALRCDLAAAVRRAGYLPEAVGSTAEALTRLAATSADLVLADVGELGAVSVLESMKQTGGGIPVVAMGADASIESALEAVKGGAHDFLRKPFSIAALEAALRVADPSEPRRRGRPTILTVDPAMQQLLREAEAAAATDATVQIVGESGTGKDLLARFIHGHSPRRNGPLVAVNCAALPEGLAASELFGHERGAFTGALESRIGQVTAADSGSLLLDEVGSLATNVQPKLLRVIQEREVQPLGSVRPHPVDLRIVATNQRDLLPEVAAGRFREDLYYRLNVIVLRIPPLRERPCDVPLLAGAFLDRFAESMGRERPRLSDGAIAQLCEHRFRGNVRELENLMRRALMIFPGAAVDIDQLLRPAAARGGGDLSTARPLNLKQIERETIVEALAATSGNRTRAARALGISVRTLRNKIRVYDLS
jgi:two-component system response regulator FlrC